MNFHELTPGEKLCHGLRLVHEAIGEPWSCAECGTIMGPQDRVVCLPGRLGPEDRPPTGFMYRIFCLPCAVVEVPAGNTFHKLDLNE